MSEEILKKEFEQMSVKEKNEWLKEQEELKKKLDERNFVEFDSVIGEDGKSKRIETDEEHKIWRERNNPFPN